MAVVFAFEIIASLLICLLSSFLFNRILQKLHLPRMLAPLIVGLLISYFLQGYAPAFQVQFRQITETFATLGIILTLFFLGLKLNFNLNLARDSSIMAINAGFLPFFFGVVATYLLGFSLLDALFVGVCLSLTAEEVSIAILEELDLVKKRIGLLIMEAGALGNFFEIIAIALLGITIKSVNLSQQSDILVEVAFELIFFFVVIGLTRYIIIPMIFESLGRSPRNSEIFLACFVVLLLMGFGAEIISFGYVIGVLVAGILIKDHLTTSRLSQQKVTEVIETVDFGIFEPMIFILIGLSIDVASLLEDPLFGLILTVFALGGKVLGSMIGSYFCKESLKRGVLVGWGLNARGATELFAVLIARNIGVLGDEIFHGVVLMALITTMVSPIIFKVLVKRWIPHAA